MTFSLLILIKTFLESIKSDLVNKKKGKKENKDRKSSTRWNEIEFNKETGTRIMYWDLYWVK